MSQRTTHTRQYSWTLGHSLLAFPFGEGSAVADASPASLAAARIVASFPPGNGQKFSTQSMSLTMEGGLTSLAKSVPEISSEMMLYTLEDDDVAGSDRAFT